MCRGLAALESCSPPVLHRDVKPSNVFVDAAGVARLGDFGLSRAMPDNSAALTGETGTYLYMSPEMIRWVFGGGGRGRRGRGRGRGAARRRWVAERKGGGGREGCGAGGRWRWCFDGPASVCTLCETANLCRRMGLSHRPQRTTKLSGEALWHHCVLLCVCRACAGCVLLDALFAIWPAAAYLVSPPLPPPHTTLPVMQVASIALPCPSPPF